MTAYYNACIHQRLIGGIGKNTSEYLRKLRESLEKKMLASPSCSKSARQEEHTYYHH